MTAPPYAVQNYRLLSMVGDGNAGRVFTARHVSDDSNAPASLVAIKVISRAKVGEAARREVDLHFDLNHPNIATLYRVSTATIPSGSSPSPSRPLSPSPTALALVMEYGAAGDLFNEVASAGVLPARHFRRRLRQVAAGLQYLHRRRIVHLDVKLENVVIAADGTAKLIDFGCARHLDAAEPISTTLGGTLHYLAPEVVADQDSPPSTSSDAWALGVLAYTALVGNYPFNATRRRASEKEEDEETKHRILYTAPHAIPDSLQIPPDLRRIIAGLLQKDPSKRMTVAEVLATLDAVPDIPARRYAHRIYSAQKALPKAEPGGRQQHQRRPRSPSGTADADFAPPTSTESDSPQTKSEAIKVVDRIIRSRMRATTEMGRLFAPIERSAGAVVARGHAGRPPTGAGARSQSRPSGRGPRRALSRDSAF